MFRQFPNEFRYAPKITRIECVAGMNVFPQPKSRRSVFGNLRSQKIKYTEGTLFFVSSCSLQCLAERPVPCKFLSSNECRSILGGRKDQRYHRCLRCMLRGRYCLCAVLLISEIRPATTCRAACSSGYCSTVPTIIFW